MAIAIPNKGKEYFIALMLANNFNIHLFTNDVTNNMDVLNTLDLGDLTEASGGGYSSKTLYSVDWTITEVENYVLATNISQTWIFPGTLDGLSKIYGYYITDVSNTTLLVVDRFAVEFYPNENGTFYSVLPTISFSSIYDNT